MRNRRWIARFSEITKAHPKKVAAVAAGLLIAGMSWPFFRGTDAQPDAGAIDLPAESGTSVSEAAAPAHASPTLDPVLEQAMARRAILEPEAYNQEVQGLKSPEFIRQEEWSAFAILHPTEYQEELKKHKTPEQLREEQLAIDRILGIAPRSTK